MTQDNGYELGESVRCILTAALNAIVAQAIEPDKRPDPEKAIDDVETFISNLPPIYRTAISLMARGIEMSPLTMGYRKKFSNLELEQQIEVINRYEASDYFVQRSTVLGLKNLLVMVYFCRPEMEEIIGYDHDCLLGAKGA